MTIKNALLLSCLTFFYAKGFCQEKILQAPFSQDTSETVGMQVHHVFNETEGSFSVTLLNREVVSRYFVQDNVVQNKFSQQLYKEDENGKPNASIGQALSKVYGSEYIGGCLNGNYLEEYYLDGSYKHIITLLTDLKTEKTVISDTIDLVRKERFVTAFLQGDAFYFVSYINNSNIVRIYKKPFGKKASNHEADITFGKNDLNGEWWEPIEKKLTNLSDFFKSSYSVLQNGKKYPLAVTSAQYKIYIFPDKLLFTCNNQFHRTLVIEVNLDNASYEVKKYEQPGIDSKENLDKLGSSTNSLILDSQLIQANILNDRFNLSFTDLRTGNVSKIYSEKNGQEPDIINGEIVKSQTDRKVYGKKDSSAASFKEMVTAIKQFQIALSGNYQNDTLRLSVGSRYIARTQTNKALSVALTAIGTLAINAIPNTFGFAVFLFGNDNSNNTVSFQSLFDKRTLTHLEGKIEKDNVRNSILQFIQKNNVQEENAFIAQSAGHYYLGYYSQNEHDFVVYQF